MLLYLLYKKAAEQYKLYDWKSFYMYVDLIDWKKTLTLFYKYKKLEISTFNTCNKLSLHHLSNALQTPKYVFDNIVQEELMYEVATLMSRFLWIKAYYSSI